MDTTRMYRTDKRFRAYVDRYAAQHCFGRSIPVKEALTHAIVRQYAEMCLEEGGRENGCNDRKK